MTQRNTDDQSDTVGTAGTAGMAGRLREIERLLTPRVVAPRRAAEDEPLPPLIVVRRHMGQMYVAGHEPHLRPVMLLAPGRPTHRSAPTS